MSIFPAVTFIVFVLQISVPGASSSSSPSLPSSSSPSSSSPSSSSSSSSSSSPSASSASSRGKKYHKRSTYRQPCLDDDDCPHWLDCQFGYHGCKVGRCDCRRPYEKYVDGRCIPAKLGNSECDEDAECPSGMTCDLLNRKCSCSADHVMTSDGLFCLGPSERALGEMCEPDVDTCYQRIGDTYTSMNIHCSARTRLCTCDATKKDDFSCRSYNLYEKGCTEIYDCEGGAICMGGTCRCPHSFKPWGNKCVSSDAILGVGFGGICDEINEVSYCNHDLVCVTCPNYCVTCPNYSTNEDVDAYGRNKHSPFNNGRDIKVCLEPLMTGLHLHSKSKTIKQHVVMFLFSILNVFYHINVS